MNTAHENRPPEGAVRGAGRRTMNRTSSLTTGARFASAHDWTPTQLETALSTADAVQLVAALDHVPGQANACTCPSCGRLRSVTAVGRWHWQCGRCKQLGTWMALRQSVAMSVEACVRLAFMVHGKVAA